MIEEIYQKAEEKMRKSVESVRSELAKIRTGKATPSLLDGIKVNYYGSQVPLKQVANLSVPEVRLIVVQPWDKSLLSEIERAILKSDLGLTPLNDGNVIRVPVPELTEERRKDLMKLVRKLGEEGKIAIRNIRRDANEQIKKGEKSGDIPEDDARRSIDDIQKLTDKHVKLIDELLEKKEKEIMEF